MSTTAITTKNVQAITAVGETYSEEKIALIKQTVAVGATDLELQLFLYTAKRTGLDPLTRQIYAIKRWNSQAGKETMTIQTGIDGYRLIADRTNKLAGIADAVFDTEEAPHPGKATVTVTKIIDGMKCEFTASARWSEYVQTKKGGDPTAMWVKMPYLMLGKCAEALALRKAFPADLSGVYTFEEMSQADTESPKETPGELVSGVLRLQEEDKNGEGREYYRFTIGEKQVCAFFDSPVVSRLIDQKGKHVEVKAQQQGNVYALTEVMSVTKVNAAPKAEPKPEPKPEAKSEVKATPPTIEAAKSEEASPILDANKLPEGMKVGYYTIQSFKAMKTRASQGHPSKPYMIVTIKDENDKPFDLFCWNTKVQAAVAKHVRKAAEIAYSSKPKGEETLYVFEGFITVEGVPVDMYGGEILTTEHITDDDLPGAMFDQEAS